MKYCDWPEARKIKARASHRRWKDRNQEKRAKYWKDYFAVRSVSEKLFKSMKARKIHYDITPNDISVPKNCPICNVEMRVTSRRGGDSQSPTLDRIVPIKGYVKGNVAVICKGCNSKKGAGSAEEHRQIADYIEARI